MKNSLNILLVTFVAVGAALGQSNQATAQGLPFGIGQQFVRNVVPQSTYRSQVMPNRTLGQPAKQTASNQGLSFGGKGSSVAISLGPGGVGVGTKDTAVAVAVGGGGVGVGVAHESGTAVSVGAGGGNVAVGVSKAPQYQLFGGTPQQSPAVQGFGVRNTTAGSRMSNQLYKNRSTSRLTGQSGYWQFSK